MNHTQLAPTQPRTAPTDTSQTMSAAELRTTREGLGLTHTQLATILDVAPRTIRHWDHGKSAINDGVRTEIGDLVTHTDDAVAAVVAERKTSSAPQVIVYQSDAEYRSAGGHYPASWHRMVVARASRIVDIAPSFTRPAS